MSFARRSGIPVRIKNSRSSSVGLLNGPHAAYNITCELVQLEIQQDIVSCAFTSVGFLFALYQTVLIPILVEWINDEDLCHLDSAVTNHKNRSFLLSILEKCSIVNTDVFATNRNERIQWIVGRGLTLRKVYLRMGDMTESSSCIRLLQAKHLVHFETTDWEGLGEMLSGLQLSVDTLRVCCRMNGRYLCSILEAVHNITHLDLSVSENLLPEVYATIGQHCPSLVRFSAPCRDNCKAVLEDCDLEEVECGLQVFDVALANVDHVCSLVKTSASDSSVSIAGRHYAVRSLLCTQVNFKEMVQLLTPYVSNQLTDFQLVTEINTPINTVQYELIEAVTERCTKLTTVVVRNAHVQENDLIRIIASNNRTLNKLMLRRQPVTDGVINSIADCVNLLDCMISHIDVAEAPALRLIQQCTKLTTFSIIQGIPLSDLTLNYFAGKVKGCTIEERNVVTFDLSDNREVHRFTYQANNSEEYPLYERVLTLNPGLLKFTVSSFGKIKKRVIQSLVMCCPALTSITLLHCYRLTGDCLPSLIDCKNLTCLHLKAMNNVSDGILGSLLESKPNLVSLALPQCTGFTSAVLALLAQFCVHIRHVDLSCCHFITDSEKVSELLKCCNKLEYLNLQHCRVTAAFLPALIDTRHMRYLNVSGTMVKGKMVKFLKSSGFTCSYMDFDAS